MIAQEMIGETIEEKITAEMSPGGKMSEWILEVIPEENSEMTSEVIPGVIPEVILEAILEETPEEILEMTQEVIGETKEIIEEETPILESGVIETTIMNPEDTENKALWLIEEVKTSCMTPIPILRPQVSLRLILETL